MSYWELSDQQRRSFNGRLTTFVEVHTPQELYSFSNRPDRPHKPDPARSGHLDPMYFMTKSNVLEAIGTSSPGVQVFSAIRRGVGLCEDWGNDLSYLFILNMPAGTQLNAWVGLAKFQPSGGGKNDVFEGGWLQYVVALEQRLMHYLDGPIRTGN